MKRYLIGVSILFFGKASATEVLSCHSWSNHQFVSFTRNYLPDSNGKGTTYPIISVDVPIGLYQFNTVSIVAPATSFSYGLGFSFLFGQRYTGRWQTALGYQYFSPKAKNNSSASTEMAKLHYLKIPLQYQFYLNNSLNVYAGAGAYGSFLIGNSANGIFKRMNPEKIDAGIISSVGFWLVPRLQIQLQAQWGMIRVDKATPQIINRNQSYNIVICFGVSNNSNKIKTKNGVSLIPGDIKAPKKSGKNRSLKKTSPIFKKVLPI